MPSGAKKRKAARRKKEIIDGSHPSSPTSPNPCQGEDHRLNSNATSGDEETAAAPVDRAVCAPDHEEGKEAMAVTPVSEEPPHGVVEDLTVHAVEKLELPLSSEGASEAAVVEDLSAPLVLEGAQEAGVVEDLSALPASEGAPEAAVVENLSAPPAPEGALEAASLEDSSVPPPSVGAPEAGVVEDLSAPPASARAPEARVVKHSSKPPADVSAYAASSFHETKEESAPLLNKTERGTEIPATEPEKRATWWNCCCLLDLFTTS